MADLAFHRFYRPRRLSEYIGNTKMKKSIMAALRAERKPQVILMQGHAGTGKTSMARLLAKEYLCSDRDDITGACGKCYNCQQMEQYIETGDSDYLMNVKEVDATDSNKRQDIDDLLEEASIPSYDGSWKIYILDECHMLTPTAQNRLLKSLEEPAEKVLMILCTTDPEKLLNTIISRCQYIFKVTKPTREELSELLARVCKNEGIEYDARALSLVCAKGDFVPRNTLIELEKVVREKQRVLYEDAVEVLSIIEDKQFFDFYDFLMRDKIDTLGFIAYLGNLKSHVDLKTFVDTLISFTGRGIYINAGVIVEALDKSEIQQYKRIFKSFSASEMAYLLNLLLRIKNSQDIEAQLLLLAYTGIRNKGKFAVSEESEESIITDIPQSNVVDEKKAGENNYNESITMSEDEKALMVESYNKPMDADAVAKLLAGTKVYED